MSRTPFTVDDANALLPRLREVLERVEAHRERLDALHARLQVLDLLWGPAVRRSSNPDHGEFLEVRQGLKHEVEEMEILVRTEVLDRGVRFPSGGLQHGLIDFPTTWDGRWVYLCWMRSEPAVDNWHEVDAGFAGRRPLTDDQRRRMGREGDPAALDDSVLDF